MSLQEALKLMRMELGLTQKDLAQKLSKTYLTVNRWENGNGFPTRKSAKDILSVARHCGVSEDCISYLEEVLMPESTRGASAAAYGFPDIDRDFLFRLADNSTNALYVIDKDSYKLIYVNRKADEMAIQYRSKYDDAFDMTKGLERANSPCYRYFAGRDSQCSFCPLAEISANGYKDIELTIPESGRAVRIHASAAVNRGKNVYIIYLTDVTQEDAERMALYELTNDIPAGVGIYHFYRNEQIELVFMNTRWYQMIGEARQKALAKNALSDFCLLHPEDKSGLLREIKAAIAEKRNFFFNMRMRMQDNNYHMLRLDGKIIRCDKEKSTFYCLFHELNQNTGDALEANDGCK